jgi:hypothetical protein
MKWRADGKCWEEENIRKKKGNRCEWAGAPANKLGPTTSRLIPLQFVSRLLKEVSNLKEKPVSFLSFIFFPSFAAAIVESSAK